MKKILAILLIVLGIGGGGAAGFFLKPAPPAATADGEDHTATEESQKEAEERNYVKIGRQTIIPVVDNGETRALMLFELAVDVPAGVSATVHEMEPRLRDAFLRELFQMSYTGAFLTNFTDDHIIEELRRNLTRTAREHIGSKDSEVLILDVMRQEM